MHFFTSSAFTEDSSAVNPQNNFVKRLKERLPDGEISICYITSSPDAIEINDLYAGVSRDAFLRTGFELARFTLIDRRNQETIAEEITKADLLFLSGGHVPTQNRFFHDLALKELIASFKGVIIGSSAGSMNASDPVYVQVEEEGEAKDPNFPKLLPGLGLYSAHIIPHLQEVRHATVDGLRIFEDIAFPDSFQWTLLALPDGSYIHVENNVTTLYGEAFEIKNGAMRQICSEGESISLG